MSRERSTICITACVLGFAGVILTPGVHAATVISEALYDAAGSDNGNVFVELYGTPGTVLEGLSLEGVNGSDGSVYLTLPLSGVIPDDGIFVVADDAGDGGSLVGDVDLVVDMDFQNGPDSIALRNASGILDALGYGDFSGGVFAGEGNAAPDAPAGSSLARLNPLADSGDNLSDFTVLDTPTPGSVPVSSVPLPPALGLSLFGIGGLLAVSRRRAGSQACGE
jgi:energy-converting hydrogenase Eha subunit B